MKQIFEIQIETPAAGYGIKIINIYKTPEMYIGVTQIKYMNTLPPSRSPMMGRCEDALELEVEHNLPVKYYVIAKPSSNWFYARMKKRITPIPAIDEIPELKSANSEMIYKNPDPLFTKLPPFYLIGKLIKPAPSCDSEHNTETSLSMRKG